MSKGTKVRNFRCPDDEWQEIVRTAEFRNKNSNDVEDTISDFIRKACREKIKKMSRSRGRTLTVADEIIDLAEVASWTESPAFPDNTLEGNGANS